MFSLLLFLNTQKKNLWLGLSRSAQRSIRKTVRHVKKVEQASNPLASLSKKTAAGLISASVKASNVKEEERSVSKEICGMQWEHLGNAHD